MVIRIGVRDLLRLLRDRCRGLRLCDVLDVADAVLSIWTGQRYSLREAREEEVYRALRGESVPPPPVEASPLNAAD